MQIEESINWYERVNKRFERECYHLKEKKFQVRASSYQNGNIALHAFCDGEPWAMISVNILHLPDGYFCAVTNNWPEVEAFLKQFDIASNTYKYAESGFCKYPIYKLDRRFTEV